jgi:hypothetical protein
MVVFAGMGETEALPVLLQHKVGTLVAGKLRSVIEDEARVDRDTPGIVVPMAQREVIDLLYGGVWPELKQKLFQIAKGCFSDFDDKNKESSREQLERLEESFINILGREIQENYTNSLIDCVAALPRYELASLAEALVSITILLARMSGRKKETVGGPIDVALVSKGDGFIWIKRKERMQGFSIS